MDLQSKISFSLRSLTVNDTEELFALTIKNKDRLKQFLNWMHDNYKKEETVEFIKESLEKEQKGKILLYAVMVKNKIAGLVDLHAINNTDKNAEVGYWIDSDAEGLGIATESTKKLMEEGFIKFNLNRIALRCAVLNTKSCAIPERLGFKKEGILRQATFVENNFLDMELWSILKEEWKK